MDQFLLDILHTANAEDDFTCVLAAVSRGLQGQAPFDAISVVRVEDDVYRFYSLFVKGLPILPGETYHQTVIRACRAHGISQPPALPPAIPLRGSALESSALARQPQVVEDLHTQCRWPEDASLLSYGIVSFVRVPLFIRDQLIGAIKFWRAQPSTYSPAQVMLLDQTASAISTTLYNRLAFERIQSLTLRLQAENQVLREEASLTHLNSSLAGHSSSLRQLRTAIQRVAPTLSTVLITGETGTGKELVAREIHQHSPRRHRPLIRINCAALPESLIASELFGHERGAFTGASQRRIGRFELASGGTLFLDEVGELPLDVQATLLRVLQEKEFERLGGTQTLTTDVRIIAATNRDLPAEIAAGRFRSDLFYRLNVFPLSTTPLRDRPEDIPVIAQHLIQSLSARIGRRFRGLAPQSIPNLLAYSWPGNVRELQNVLERAMILSDSDQIVVPGLGTRANPASEVSRISDALQQTRGRVSGPNGAATLLGVPPSTLESRIRSLGIDKFQFRRA